MKAAGPAPRGGFTLMEVMVVLVLMGAAAGLALPFLKGSLDSLTGAASERRLVSFLNDARSRALNTGSPVEVVCDFEGQSFVQVLGREEKERLALPRGVKLISVEVDGTPLEEGTPAITFYPLGDSSGGAITLDDRGRKSRVTVGILFATPVLAPVAD